MFTDIHSLTLIWPFVVGFIKEKKKMKSQQAKIILDKKNKKFTGCVSRQSFYNSHARHSKPICSLTTQGWLILLLYVMNCITTASKIQFSFLFQNTACAAIKA